MTVATGKQPASACPRLRLSLSPRRCRAQQQPMYDRLTSTITCTVPLNPLLRTMGSGSWSPVTSTTRTMYFSPAVQCYVCMSVHVRAAKSVRETCDSDLRLRACACACSLRHTQYMHRVHTSRTRTHHVSRLLLLQALLVAVSKQASDVVVAGLLDPAVSRIFVKVEVRGLERFQADLAICQRVHGCETVAEAAARQIPERCVRTGSHVRTD